MRCAHEPTNLGDGHVARHAWINRLEGRGRAIPLDRFACRLDATESVVKELQ